MTRRRVGAGVALLAAVAIVLIIVLSAGPSGSSAHSNDPVNAAGTTSVQRRDLVETDTESGTLSYAYPQTVYNSLSGTITWLPAVGQLIKPGHTLYKIDDVPVMLMKGSTPAFRDLSGDDTPGPDILELNRNLIALGFNPDGIVADDVWQPATTDGVDVLQAYLGQTETGILSLGQVVFLPGPQLVSTLDETLGADPAGATSAASLSTSGPAATGSTEFVDLTTGTTTTPQTTTPRTITPPKGHRPGQRQPPPCLSNKAKGMSRPKQSCPGGNQSLKALIALLKAEIAELKAEKSGPSSSGSSSGPSGSSNSGGGSSGGGKSGGGGSGGGSSRRWRLGRWRFGGGASGGGGGGGSTAVLETTSTQLVVTVDLDASKQSEAKVGEKVTVEMPNGGTVNGKISAVSSVATSSSGDSGSGSGGGGSGSGGGAGGSGSSSSSIPVTVTLDHPPKGAGLDQAAVSVNFAEAQAKNVLSVPVTALLAVPGGGYAVQQAAAPHRLINVRTGLFAAGFVQVSGSGIVQGLQVSNSEG